MTDVVLFHHVLGLTDGVRAFADRLATDGHVVHTPDLYDGQVAESLDDGFAIRTRIGDDTIAQRVERAVSGQQERAVYAGMSLGVMTAQRLAQTRRGAVGALLYEACLPVTGEWAVGPWPDDVAVQVHGMDDDEFFAHEGDLDAARELVSVVGAARAELFVYEGSGHLFIDSSLPSFDATTTDRVIERSLDFLDRLDSAHPR
jgi:dienelactone hydrolase